MKPASHIVFEDKIDEAMCGAVRAGIPAGSIANYTIRRLMETLLFETNGDAKQVRDILFKEVQFAVSLANEPEMIQAAKEAAAL